MAKKFDPYEVLGVPKDADAQSVKAAYRRRARQTHPDAGGKRDAFEEVNRANIVLADPTRRARYDETGASDDDDNPDTIEAKAWSLIADLVGQVIAKEENPERIDIVVAMRKQFEHEQAQIRTVIAQTEARVAKITRLKGRFKRKKGFNTLDRMVAKMAEDAKKPITEANHRLEICKCALKLLKDCDFERDIPPEAKQFTSWITLHTNTV